MKYFLLAFSLTFILFSCNCHFEGKGYIYNKESKKPMKGVRIEVASNKPWKDTLLNPIYTDSNGFFEYSHDFCYNSMSAHYPNYISHTFSQAKGDTLYLEYLEGNGVEDFRPQPD